MFDFVGRRKYWFTISAVLLTLAIGAFIYNGIARQKVMNFGIDFTGGTLINLRFPDKVSVEQVRDVLAKHDLGQSVIQKSGDNDIYIRTEELERNVRVKIIDDLKAEYGDVVLLEADTIGPVIGKELRSQAIWALLIASFLIIVYVSIRFEFKYAVAALIALYHDTLITAGLIALLWRTVDAPFVAAILTIMGYSINDTIVIFDRIRENIKKHGGKKRKFGELVNVSVNETLGRSINTTLTTLIVVLSVLFFGGDTLKDFALVLLIGFAVGAYSSLFVASPIIAAWESKK